MQCMVVDGGRVIRSKPFQGRSQKFVFGGIKVYLGV